MKRSWLSHWVAISMAFFISALFFAYFQFQNTYITSTDGFYHIKYAFLLRTEGFISHFKWAAFSSWFESFSDKEFLYHVLLIPFTYFEDLQLGMKIATVLFASVAATSFFAILKLNRVRFSWFWYAVLMLSGGYFLFRINSPRPQALSVILALWSVHFVVNRRRVPLAIVSFIYCTAYTAFFLPLLFSLVAGAYRYFVSKELEWQTTFASFSGLVLGMVIHPYFPQNLTFVWLQNFYVMWLQQGTIDLHIAGELDPMSTRHLIYSNTAMVLAFLAAYVTALLRPRKIDVKTGQLFILALLMLALTAHAKRFTEYAVPMTLLFSAQFFHLHLKDLTWHDVRTWIRCHRIPSAGLALFAVVLGLFLVVRTQTDLRIQLTAKESRYKSAALYLKDLLPKDEVVFTCDWDDAPELWFYNSDNSYLVFLDPTFMYYRSPKLWQIWDMTSNGLLGESTYNVLKEDFGVRYGVCTANFRGLYNIIQRDPRMEIIHRTDDIFVFKVQ